jgi:hypothetical protein
MKITYIPFLTIIPSVFCKGGLVATCPISCPSCMKCDPFKGTCTAPRDFVSCTIKTVTPNKPGICYSGVCTDTLTLSPPLNPTKPIGICETYNCNNTKICTFSNKRDGTSCLTPSQLGIKIPPVCIKGSCSNIILGLSDLPPYRNIGCLGIANGSPCDTNDVLGDGETCQNGICIFPDGTFYGLLP